MSDAVAQLKAQLKDLMSKKDKIEQDVNDITARLNAPGMPGLSGSLLDKEGYPRADIDVASVRADRHRLVCFTNDHKDLMKQIDKMLVQLHEAARTQHGSPAPPALAPSTQPAQAPKALQEANAMEVEEQVPVASTTGAAASQLRPFAVIDEITEGSPAATAGLQLGDQLCKFGDVISSGGGELQRVAAVLAAHENVAVEALVLRHGEPHALQLTPQRWAGRGLLGCHLRPF